MSEYPARNGNHIIVIGKYGPYMTKTLLYLHTVRFIKPYRNPVKNTPDPGKVLLNG